MNGGLSAGILSYGIVGLCNDWIWIPGKRTSGLIMHGWAAGLMFCAMLAASLNLASVIVDHYDRRDNEHDYRRFARISATCGWVLFIFAFVVAILVPGAGERMR